MLPCYHVTKTGIFWKTEKIIQIIKTQKRIEICQNKRYTLRPEVSNPSGSVVSTMFCKAKNIFLLFGDFRPLLNKNVQIWDHFFPLLFPKDSESLNILDIRLQKVGAKRRLNGTSKVNTRTDRRTDRQTDRWTNRLTETIGPEGRCFEKIYFLTGTCPNPYCVHFNPWKRRPSLGSIDPQSQIESYSIHKI